MFKKTGKSKNVLCILALLLISLFLIGTVSAAFTADVGYILKYKSKVDKNVLQQFNEMGLSYELIEDSKILNYDLSKYKFLFIDDVRLTNTRNLPIYNYPSVIMNGYHGEEWGLTDNDGMSQLSADQPLNVRLVDDGLNQVYTKAEVNGKNLYYYYLTDKNCELNNFQTVARTWTGNVETNDIGDVISIAPAGTVLMNGETSGGNMCFYGIIKTDYWTEDAKDLFKRCVGYVSFACSDDEQCPSDEESEFYCKDDDVYKDVTDFFCKNSETSSSECDSNMISELIETCEYSCENGGCLPECNLDSQCNEDYYSDNYCLNNSVYHDFHDFLCENEECKEEIIKQIAETCEYSCENGECQGQCNVNSDCGSESYSNEYCDNGNVVIEHITPICTDNKCYNETEIEIIEICSAGCENGDCIVIICDENSDCNDNDLYTFDECNNPGTAESYCTNTPVNCVTNNDCGITGFVGWEICSEEDVVKYFQNSTCINPETTMSYCDVLIEQIIVKDCGDSFCDDYGENYCKNNDVYHSKTCYEKGCEEGACLSSSDEEESLVEKCENGCDNGKCSEEKIHDVGFIDFTDSINKIRIENLEGNVLGADDELECNNQYKIYVELKNKGDFTENITFNGNIDGLTLNHNPKDNLAPEDTTLKYKTININLSSGTYNVIVNAVIPSDANLSDNTATRQIKVICSVCVDNDYDGYGKNCQEDDCDDNNANVHPGAAEICNGIDDNCDGIIDEDCECINGDTKKCGSSDIGECEFGLQTCSNGKWGQCAGNIEPHNEICDLKDNDCDGVVDENNGDCEQGEVCIDGECREISCDYNSDCGTDDYAGDLFCEDNEIYQNYQAFKCNNPGTYNSYCTNSIIPELIEQCSDNQLCSNAECKEIECSDDSDCDDDNYFTTDKCNNPGTIDSYCTNEPVTCRKNSDCGRDGWTGDLFCSSNNIFQNFITYKCNNQGTSESYCSHNTNAKLIEECEQGQVCANGQCKEITCHEDSDCNDGNLYTQDECNNPGTADSYCSHDFVNCVTNNDCGPTGFIGFETCAEDDIVKFFQNSTCFNSGTMMSYCEISITQMLIKDCGEDYCNGFGQNYCKNNDVYHSKTCYEKGCEEGACFSGTSSIEEELVTECEHGCDNGICTGECDEDSKCGTESYSDYYCYDDKVARKHFIPKCIDSECSIQEIIETIEICLEGCEDGECISTGIHDVALMDFTNSFNKIKLETLDGINILEPTPTLRCGDSIKAKIKVLNKGDFTENVIIKGNVDGINFTFSNINNLVPGDSTYRSSLFPYIKLDLASGLYNLIVNVQIPFDNNPSDNTATRQIRIVCGECEDDDDCESDEFCESESCGSDDGSCVDVPEICPTLYAPVCGCDEKTYSNDCFRKMAKAIKSYDGECENECDEAEDILGSIYSVVNGGVDYFTLNQAKTGAFCNNDDILLAGAGTMAQCSNSATPACNYNVNYELNGPTFSSQLSINKGWQSLYSSEEQDKFYDTVREEAICLPLDNTFKYFSIYIVKKGTGNDIYSLNQDNQIALCDAGDKVISGGGYAPHCDSNNPACGKKQYLEFNEPITIGNQEGWRTAYDVHDNAIYDTVQTFAVCLKKTQLFDEKFKIYTLNNKGSSSYNLDQSKTTVLCYSGDIAIGGGGNAPYCDTNNPACGKTQYLEFNGKITTGNQQGWQTLFDLTGNAIYDTQKVSVVCIGLADNCF